MEERYTVYVRTDEQENIIEVNSSMFLKDAAGWRAIDEGTTDQYRHAQGNYFANPLFDMQGCANYTLADGAPRLRTEEEKAAQLAARPASEPTQLDRVEAQATYTAMMTDTLLGVNGYEAAD